MRPYTNRRVLAGIWAAFIARAIFYCVHQPMWEGFDEWAHFAYVQHIGEHGNLPSRTSPISREVQRSLELVPLSPSAAAGIPGSITHDAFWKLEPREIRIRERELRSSARTATGMPHTGITQYEAQQPPLYYLVLAPAYLVIKPLSLPAKVLLLRILSTVIASCVVFLGYAVARRVLPNRALALLVPAQLACLPGLFIDLCRIGNESLSIVLTSAVILFALRASEPASRVPDWCVLGALTGCALLTKAYALALLPLLPLVSLIRALRRRAWKEPMAKCALAVSLAAATAGWWYWKSWVTTGTLSGEQLDVAAVRFAFFEKLALAPAVNWWAVIDTAAFSHVWIGGWSFLVARSWMYRLFEIAGVVAAAGVLVCMVRWTRARCRVVVLAAAYAFMCMAVAYHALVVYLVHKTSTAIGWYLYAVIVPEAVLLGAGMAALFGIRYAGRMVAGVCVLAGLLDLYTVHFVLTPHYTGHDAAATVPEMLRRLAVNEPAAIGAAGIGALWGSYVCATVALAVLAVVMSSPPRARSLRPPTRPAAAPVLRGAPSLPR